MTAAVDVEPHLPAHLDYLRLRNQRPRSIAERRFAVLRAARRLAHPVADVDTAGLAGWQRSLVCTPAGMGNEVVHVSQYLRWLVREGIRDTDPSAILVRPHLTDRLPRPLGDADIAHAMATAGQPLRAWIALGAFCGLRCMEIADLTREDVVDGLDTPFLRIVGKGGKERVVPLPASVLAELKAAGMPTRGHVFDRMGGGTGPPSPKRVSDRINRHLHDCDVAGTAHQLRHRFGTKLYEATRDPFLVAAVMGHASTETTKGYVRISPHTAAAPIELISRLTAPAELAETN